jgi:DNA-binding transcriptional MerR regulator
MAPKARAQKRLYYKIGEACKTLGIQPYVLRYWETEFPALTPSKSRSGQRVYSEKELEIIRRIKELLYEEGYTIAGAKKKLEGELAAGALGEPDGEGAETAGEAADETPLQAVTPMRPNGYNVSSRGSLKPSRRPVRFSPSWGRSRSEIRSTAVSVGTWRSLVAYLNGVQGVPGSNPGVPTNFLL